MTKAEGNVVHELDGEPAWKIWKEVARESTPRRARASTPSHSTPPGRLLRYEAGVARWAPSCGIRAPLSVNPVDRLRLRHPPGDVDAGHREHERPAASARAAARLARPRRASAAARCVLDCICGT